MFLCCTEPTAYPAKNVIPTIILDELSFLSIYFHNFFGHVCFGCEEKKKLLTSRWTNFFFLSKTKPTTMKTKEALIAIFILFIIAILLNVFFPISLRSFGRKGEGTQCDAACARRKAEANKEKEKTQRVKGAPTERNTFGRRLARRLEVWNWGKKHHNSSEVEDYQQHRHDDKINTRRSGNFNLNQQLSGIFRGGGIGGSIWR